MIIFSTLWIPDEWEFECESLAFEFKNVEISAVHNDSSTEMWRRQSFKESTLVKDGFKCTVLHQNGWFPVTRENEGSFLGENRVSCPKAPITSRISQSKFEKMKRKWLA